MTSRADESSRPCIALTVGDPAGIGPEIALQAMRDPGVRARVRLVVIGPVSSKPADVALARREDRFESAFGADVPAVWLAIDAPRAWEMGRAQESSGHAALAALRAGHELAMERRVHALVTGPVSKEALHLAGEQVEGQTELLGRWSGVSRYEMVAIADRLRVMLLTRHLPLRRALDQITGARVLDRLTLFDECLKRLGFASPSLAIAGLNPHAGENGILGTEEREVLGPAIDAARARGVRVSDPQSPDTVFLQASRGRFDGVLALYHDQAFIPVKLLSEDRGLTWIAGLPYLRISPVHGTAFDIAGRGIASPANLIAALHRAGEWSRSAESSARTS